MLHKIHLFLWKWANTIISVISFVAVNFIVYPELGKNVPAHFLLAGVMGYFVASCYLLDRKTEKVVKQKYFIDNVLKQGVKR